ncbi:SusC/RagA family TonB-linked outer membrane protein [Chitinophagaceae bacterium 26-R-25]|nr:SusC/RagA family TonB-linked outer membrane protein [Chitinophagaceae bacterium 26-R-25]
MKLTSFFLLIGLLSASAKGVSQRVTFTGRDVHLKKIFEVIEHQTGYVVVYSKSLIKTAKPITVSARDISLEEFLSLVSKDQPFRFVIDKNTVLISPRPTAPPVVVPSEEKQVVLVPVFQAKGVVRNESDEPIVGASVLIKGSKTGTVTDATGKFSLDAEPGNILVISSIGYETMSATVTSASEMRIRMKVTTESMKDMVVTGLLSRPKETFTGAASSFAAEDLKKVNSINILAALTVLDPSLHIVENINTGSNPNKLPDIVLRAGNSMPDISDTPRNNLFGYANSPNVPLFILDGFEVNLQRINDLDMNRVAKIDILKDAAATAIYGSRAANGVIVVETVRPKAGKMQLSYNLSLSTETPDLTSYDLLNAREKLDLENKLGLYTDTMDNNNNLVLQGYYNTRLAEINRGVNTDWMAQPLRTAVSQRHNLYVEGGAGDVLYGMSGFYNVATGVMKGSGRKNSGATSFLSYRAKNIQIRNELSLNFNRADESPYGSFGDYTRLNPYLTPYDSTGQMKFYLEDLTGSSVFIRQLNPMYNATLNVINKTNYTTIANNFSVLWQAAKWLRLTARASATKQSNEGDKFLPAQHTSFAGAATFDKGSYTKSWGKSTGLDANFIADFNYRIQKHQLFATVNANITERSFSTQTVTVVGFPNPTLDQFTAGYHYPTDSKPFGTENISRLVGLLSSVSYAYDSKYLLDLSYRLDGSSQFGSNRRTAPFWSVGAGWNLHREKLLSNISWLNRFKIRYSYGVTGSQNFNSFLGLNTSNYYNDREYRGIIGTYLMAYGNPNLQWQTTYKNNLGVDLTLFNRLDITANYFIEKTKGSIASISIPPSLGFTSYSENLGDLIGKGWELNTRFNIIANRKSRNNWSVFANFFSAESKIEKVSNTIKAINRANATSSSSKPRAQYAEGQSTTAIWAVPSMGIDPSNGLEIYKTRDGKLTNIYNPQDQVIVGDSRADVEGSFGTNLEINGIGFNIFLQFRVGGQAYNQTLVDRVENVNIPNNNVDRRVAEQRWMKPGDQVFFKGARNLSGVSTTTTYATSRFVQDNNVLHAQSVSVYYRFSDSWNKKMRLSNTRISLYTGDLFNVSSIKRERGLEYPFSRSYTLQFQTSL